MLNYILCKEIENNIFNYSSFALLLDVVIAQPDNGLVIDFAHLLAILRHNLIRITLSREIDFSINARYGKLQSPCDSNVLEIVNLL